jgi:hypothetical protein
VELRGFEPLTSAEQAPVRGDGSAAFKGFNENPANKLTNPILDPYGKMPEFKYCAARVAKNGKLLPRKVVRGEVFTLCSVHGWTMMETS